MAVLHITDHQGQEHKIEALIDGRPIMEILLDEGFDVGLCGGMGSCGTCCGLVSLKWSDKLGQINDVEEMMTADVDVPEGLCARLTCQIPFDASADGVQITLVPIE